MKIVVHILGIIALFLVILAAPAVIDALKRHSPPSTASEKKEPPQASSPETKPETAANDYPPQPQPAEPAFKPMPPRDKPLPMEKGGGVNFIVGEKGVGDKMVHGTFQSGGGHSTLTADGAGWASLDGEQLINVGIYMLRNNQPNVLYIYRKGLQSLKDGVVFVDGDSNIDVLRLDGRMNWAGPMPQGALTQYSTLDSDGRSFVISVSGGISVEILQR